MAETEQPKIVVEVPRDTIYSPLQPPKINKLEEFKQGWINAIALPDNITDLVFDLTASITIPALFASCWVSLPVPSFLKIGGLIAVAIAIPVVWQMLVELTEVRSYITLRLALVALGVMIGL